MSTGKLRLLMVHGSMQDADVFAHKTEKLVTKGQREVFTTTFINGCLPLPLQEGQQVAMRGWWNKECTVSPLLYWHNLPPTRYDCTVTRLQMSDLLKAFKVIDDAWASQGPFDGVLGFSQGASLVALWLHCAINGPCWEPAAQMLALPGFSPPGQPHPPLPLPTLLVIGQRDPVVPPAESLLFKDRFNPCNTLDHQAGHVVPQNAYQISKMLSFMSAHAADVPPSVPAPAPAAGECPEHIKEEFESLSAVYEDAFMSAWPGASLCLRNVAPELQATRLEITLPPAYPEETPRFALIGPARASPQATELIKLLQEQAADMLGVPMLFTLLSFADTWAADGLVLASPGHCTGPAEDLAAAPPSLLVSEENTEARLRNVQQATFEARSCGAVMDPLGRDRAWRYVIGLVGKPSAGKSTLFNALTHAIREGEGAKASSPLCRSAAVAAYPFTTIDPNVGKGYVAVPCPCSERHMPVGAECGAPFGHTADGQRLVPVTLKDVAGLVPGAYSGRGKGNRFLDDLCDADVLVHVVDASGTTDAEGVEGEGDPLHDIQWVQHEVHNWIYDNLCAKWDTVLRKPEKLLCMFSGYHAREALVRSALCNAGCGDLTTANVASWDRLTVHRIVAHFIQLRLPVMLALNKADKPEAACHISRIRTAFPNDTPMAPVSAQLELELLRLHLAGAVVYHPGDAAPQILAEGHCPPEVLDKVHLVASHDLPSGVLCVARGALGLRPPVTVFPVSDLDSLRGVSDPALLHDVVLLTPGSTVHDLYKVMSRPSCGWLQGEFVRAEARLHDGSNVVLRKHEQ
eukprot:gene9631-252_t